MTSIVKRIVIAASNQYKVFESFDLLLLNGLYRAGRRLEIPIAR
jgi:hypothetical protein